MKLKISELFYSIQGEGRYMGVPSVFLRTFGCNFQCAGFGMRKGEKRLLIVPYELGYGTRGRSPDIPRAATLVFEVALVDIKPRSLPGQ